MVTKEICFCYNTRILRTCNYVFFHRTFIFTREDQLSEPGTTGPQKKSNGTNKRGMTNQRTSIRENDEINREILRVGDF
jgi:hypothetical protein